MLLINIKYFYGFKGLKESYLCFDISLLMVYKFHYYKKYYNKNKIKKFYFKNFFFFFVNIYEFKER